MPTRPHTLALLRALRLILFSLNLTLLALLLFLWPLSHFYSCSLDVTPNKFTYTLTVDSGRLIALCFYSGFGYSGPPLLDFRRTPIDPTYELNHWSYSRWNYLSPDGHHTREWSGLALLSKTLGHDRTGFAIPLSYLVLTLSIWPLLTLRQKQTRPLNPKTSFPTTHPPPIP